MCSTETPCTRLPCKMASKNLLPLLRVQWVTLENLNSRFNFTQNFNNNSQTWWQLAVKLKDWSEAMKDFIKFWLESAFVDEFIEIDFTQPAIMWAIHFGTNPTHMLAVGREIDPVFLLLFKANKFLPFGFSSHIRSLSRCSPLIERLIVKLYSISVCDNPPRKSSRKNIYRSRQCRH